MDHAERITNLEIKVSEQVLATAELTRAVNNLTNVLTSGKLALKILCYVASAVAALATAFAWLSDHVGFIK